jgi:hypothetical protein
VGAVRDYGFYVQMAHMIVPNRIELYGATSYIFGNTVTRRNSLWAVIIIPGTRETCD